MQTNVGGKDRTARLAAGAALAGGALFAPVDGRLRAAMGAGAAIALASGLSRYCPLNAQLGVDTSKAEGEEGEIRPRGGFKQIGTAESGASAAGMTV